MSPEGQSVSSHNTAGNQGLPPWMLTTESHRNVGSRRLPHTLVVGTSITVPVEVARRDIAVSVETRLSPSQAGARQRWEELETRNWPDEGREERIARGLAALDAAIVDYGLDADTARWIAEDADLEDM